MKQFLITLYNSLDLLAVRGRDNIEIVLGCMNAIEQKMAELEADEQIPGPIITENTGPIIHEQTEAIDG